MAEVKLRTLCGHFMGLLQVLPDLSQRLLPLRVVILARNASPLFLKSASLLLAMS